MYPVDLIHNAGDIIYSQLPNQDWRPSPIVEINGQDTIEFLTNYADINAANHLEQHGDWNSLMDSPILDILGIWSRFQSGNIYPGGENNAPLNVKFKNGSWYNETWSAVYQEASDTGSLTTASDFYNYFVTGIKPINWNATGWWPNRTSDSDAFVLQWQKLNQFHKGCLFD